MPFVIKQRLSRPIYKSLGGVDLTFTSLHVVSITRKGEFALGEDRAEAVRFKTEKEAQEAIKSAGTPDCEIIELKGPHYEATPSTPAGWVLAGLERGPTNLQELNEELPAQVRADLSLEDLLGLVCRVQELIPVPPPAVDLILLQGHIRLEHARRKPKDHTHLAEYGGQDGDEIIVPARTRVHHHESDIDRLGKEVKRMATATKTKARKAKGEKAPKKEKVLHPCHCGCGGTTFSNFQPGHDARVYALLKKEAGGEKVKLPKELTDNTALLTEMRGKVH